MPFALMTHEWYQLGLDSLSVPETDWGWTRDRASSSLDFVRSLTDQEKNGNMTLFCFSAFFSLFNITTAHSSNIVKIYTIWPNLMLCFVQCDAALLFCLKNVQIRSSTCTLFLRMNELVNIQMTPQKNWHLERIEYKHLYSFMLTTEYFSLRCVGERGFTDAGNLVWMHREEKWRGFYEDCHLLSIASPLTPSECLLRRCRSCQTTLNSSPLERTLQINFFFLDKYKI